MWKHENISQDWWLGLVHPNHKMYVHTDPYILFFYVQNLLNLHIFHFVNPHFTKKTRSNVSGSRVCIAIDKPSWILPCCRLRCPGSPERFKCGGHNNRNTCEHNTIEPGGTEAFLCSGRLWVKVEIWEKMDIQESGCIRLTVFAWPDGSEAFSMFWSYLKRLHWGAVRLTSGCLFFTRQMILVASSSSGSLSGIGGSTGS